MDDPASIDILIGDDHPDFREGIRQLLEAEPDVRIVGEAESAEEAVAKVRALKPHVVVLDAAMARLDDHNAVRTIAAQVPDSRILVLVMNAVEECRRFALDSGAAGCLSKLRADRELEDAVRSIAAGGVYFTALDVGSVSGSEAGGNGVRVAGPRPGAVLSERERQVVTLTARGYSSREIGEKLHISSKTVDTYRARSMEKLRISHRWELVRYALRYGLLAAR